MKEKKYKHALSSKAVHAQAFRWPPKLPTTNSQAMTADIEPSEVAAERSVMAAISEQPVLILEATDDCLTHRPKLDLSSEAADSEYTGGINHDPDMDWEAPVDSDLEDTESLCELEGEELEKNLAALQLLVAEKSRKSEWSKVFGPADWKRAEKNRALGYNGHSDWTRRLREKEARDRATASEKVKAL